MKKEKKAVFFSADALIALTIIILSVMVIYPVIKYSEQKSYVESDAIKVLSSLKISEINNSYVKNLVSEGKIKNLNNSLLEQIGEFYVENISIARELAENIFSDLKTEENIGIWYGSTLIYLKNSTSYENAKDVFVERQVITGIREGGSVTGFSSRAYLEGNIQTKYIYFGGYVGDGNLSANININYSGDLSNIGVEIAVNKDFDAYINDIYSGHYQNSSSEFQPSSYDLSAYREYFHTGSNKLEFRGDNLYIAGGYIKITYENPETYFQLDKYYFPGINGVINLYDGFYSPKINEMKILLHYNSSYNLFLNIGNTTVYNASSVDEIPVVLDNVYLSSKLDYNSISNKTVPIRLGLEEIIGGGQGGNADVILITDVSGSMDWRMDSDTAGTVRTCNEPNLMASSTQRLSLAKCLDINFTKTVLSGIGNRIGLVSFSTDADGARYVNLTSNQTLLNTTILAYQPISGTCVACAINRAYLMLKEQSSPNRKKFIIVMTDGVANYRSTETCTNIYGIGTYKEDNPFAGGQDGVLLDRNDSGVWNSVNSPTTNQINDIDFFNESLGFGVGNSGLIIKWDGNWNTIGSPTGNTVYGIDFYNASFALAVGSSGRVIKWDGNSWTNLATISGNYRLYSISIYNSSLMFAAGIIDEGNDDGRIYKSINGGATWSTDYSLEDYDLRGIKIISNNLGYAVGEGGRIREWNGNSWSSVSSPTTEYLYSIDAFNPSEIYAAGGNDGYARIIKNNGVSWTSVYNYANSVDSLRDIVTLNGKVYSFGEQGTIVEYNGSWNRNFNIPSAYQGNKTSGIYCKDNDACSQPNSFSAMNAEYSACRAYNEINSTAYSIGFGPIATCGFANQTLKGIAGCGNGSFYASTDANALQSFYQQIAYDILKLSYKEQTSNISGSLITKLYPDSYIEFNYTKKQFPYGLKISLEKQFSDKYSGSFLVPLNSTVIEARVISYSGPRWTNNIYVNGISFYNLSEYDFDYRKLGDPYSINIPIGIIQASNIINLTTGVSPDNSTQGSEYNKIIYTILRNISSYSPISSKANGCIWEIEFEDNSNSTIKIPENYSSAEQCYYLSSRREVANENDAIQNSVFNLLKLLDFDSNGKLDIKLSEQDFYISYSEITGIPYEYATEVQARRWY